MNENITPVFHTVSIRMNKSNNTHSFPSWWDSGEEACLSKKNLVATIYFCAFQFPIAVCQRQSFYAAKSRVAEELNRGAHLSLALI